MTGHLDIRKINDSRAPERFCIVRHAIEDESVKPIACPGVRESQRFVHEERLAEVIRALDGTLEREVRLAPPLRCHPIEHPRAVAAGFVIVEPTDTVGGNGETGRMRQPASQLGYGILDAGPGIKTA